MSATGDVYDGYRNLNLSLPELRQQMVKAEAEMSKFGELPEWFRFMIGKVQTVEYDARRLMQGVTFALDTEHDDIIHHQYDCGISECQNPYCKQSPNRMCPSCEGFSSDGHICVWSNKLQRMVKLSKADLDSAKASRAVQQGAIHHVNLALRRIEAGA